MEIVIGTYEEFLVGYKLVCKKKDSLLLKQSFTNHAHCGSVRSIAVTGKYLASGSIDEVIHLVNIKHRVDSGTLISHTGTITALEFLRSTYLFSASEDGTICIWNSKRKWACEKVLRGHKDAVNSLSIHSSGKLLLSVSKDKTLRTWNLIKGRCAYIINLKDVAHQVLWSPRCEYFAVVFDLHLDIYDIATGGIAHTVDRTVFNNKRINKVLFLNDNHLLLCGDCNEIVIYDFIKKKMILKFSAHDNRIKDIACIKPKNVGADLVDPETIVDSIRWLISTSSDGFIKIWKIDLDQLSDQPNLLTQVNTTCRPTCMAVHTSISPISNEKFENFSIPELKISKEELEVCKAKLKEKKQKRKIELTETNDVDDNDEATTNITDEKTKTKRMKKTDKTNSDKNNNDDDDDHDGELEAFRNMKAKKKASDHSNKPFKKRKKSAFGGIGRGGGSRAKQFRASNGKHNVGKERQKFRNRR